MNHDKYASISDEQLSAFLDAELPEAEMEIIRERLVEDETLANRLAELAMVDEIIAMSYKTIDVHPLPNSISNLLTENESKSADIIAFPLLKKIQQNIQKHVAIAASVTLVIGFGISQTINKDNREWHSVAQILEQTASGVEQSTSEGVKIKSRLTFINKEGDYCRQFVMQDKSEVSENIACRKNNQWKRVERVAVDQVVQAGTYQTASGGSALDEKIEQMASGDFFDEQAESVAINHHWAKSN